MSKKMTIKLLGISGSPRIGATDYAVRTALDYSKEKYQVETEYFSVHNKKISFCIHCDYCIRKKQGCIHRDDMTKLYTLLEEADAWILGSPVYHGAISGQLKTLLDRTRASVAGNKSIFAGKAGAALAVGGDRSGGQEAVLRTIIDFYIINEMIPAGGGAFGANLGASLWSKDKKAEGIKVDEEGIKTIHKTVGGLIKTASRLRNLS